MAPFCSCPASLVSRKFFAVGPGCAKCFFFCCAPSGAATFRRGQSKKKNTTQGGKAREGEAPLEAGTGPEQKVFFKKLKKKTFCSGPVPASNGASPSPAFRRGRSKKKKHPGWCFFFCSGPVPASNGASPSLAFRRGRSKKKKHPGWCFFFCCGPARTLTHSLRAWVAMPPPRRGGAFFFAAAPPGPGWCFFFAVAPPGRSLTHGGLGRFRQGPGGVFFFAAAPPGLFRE